MTEHDLLVECLSAIGMGVLQFTKREHDRTITDEEILQLEQYRTIQKKANSFFA